MRLPAFQIIVGDRIDLEGDPFADPTSSNPSLACELAEVCEVTYETADCVAIGFDGFDIVGFPRYHLLNVVRSSDSDPAR